MKLANATCQISTLKDEDIELEFADGAKETIANGTCTFKCTDFSEDLSTQVTFAYTSAPDLKVGTTGTDGKSYPFIPLPIKKFSELPKYTIPMGPICLPTSPQGGDGTDVIITEDTLIDPGLPPPLPPPGDENKDDPSAQGAGGGEPPVSQSSGCSLIR